MGRLFRTPNLLILLAAALIALVPGCGKDKPPGPDATPPAAVTDLTLLRTTETNLTITWTAPGDDGDEGQAASYDLRYSLSALPAGWDSTTVVQGLAIPRQAGQPETVTVSGLTRDRIYHLALRTLDDAGNESGLSNIIQAQTGDQIPPGTVTNLRVTVRESRAVTLLFTATGDDGYAGTATTYEVRYGSIAVTEETWEESTAYPVTQAPQAAGTVETIRAEGLTPEATLHFALRARDDGGNVGPVSNDVVVTLPGDTTPPAAITDLVVSGTEPYKLTLTWTASGEDGTEGRATSYAIRYAGAAITEENWGPAVSLDTTLVPKESGGREELKLADLEGDQTLWFCVRATDSAGNQSPVSNAAKGYVRRPPRTWVVRVDGGGDASTVQAGIDSSRHGDVVLVGPGTYYENINLKGKQIHLKGEEGAEATILDGSQGDNSVVTSDPSEYTPLTIEGFTITGGIGQAGCSRLGGGVYSVNTSLTLQHCIVRGNRVDSTPPCFNSRGAGVYLDSPSSGSPSSLNQCLIIDNYSSGNAAGLFLLGPCVVQDNVIRGNRTGRGDGGGVYVSAFRGPMVLQRNQIVENTANDHGGGIYISNSNIPASMVDVAENLIVSNEALGADVPGALDGSGGGCWMSRHGSYFHHNTVAFNRADRIRGTFASTGGVHLLDPSSDVRVEHNLIYRNSDGGISAFGSSGDTWSVVLSRNLVFENGLHDILAGTRDPADSLEIALEENIFADPLFCVIGPESRGELAYGSPALTQAFGIIGAVDHGSCELNTAPQVLKTTWQTIKAIYPH